MTSHDLAQLELLAEIDALVADLRAWRGRAPDWTAARPCAALVERLMQRTDTLRVRFDAPLVVATLGGTGTGKSSLVNALVGADVTTAGRERPTTRRPVLICRPDLSPRALDIDPDAVEVVHHDSPLLRDVVLLDCPDPDTTEDVDATGTNLARLRRLLPHCDVLLVTSTQQKYRSARVIAELATAAPGARLIFVQTHADTDDDVRDDWRQSLGGEYALGEMFFVDSLAARRDVEAGRPPHGEMGRLLDLLSRELSGTAAKRIRRANFLDLLRETLHGCDERLLAGLPAVEQLEQALVEQRARLAARMAGQLRDELIGSRRPWESRVVAEVAARWGFSPFSCLLRIYQGLGGLVSGAALMRVRTPAQAALWGAWEVGRRWRSSRKAGQADAAIERATALGWDETELRTAAIVVSGYTAEAGLPRDDATPTAVMREATAASAALIERAAGQVRQVVSRLAVRHTGWFTRWRYELLLLVVLGVLMVRFGRNFFWDSWLAVEFGYATTPAPLLGVDFFLGAGLLLVLWCGLLLWMFTGRLRRGMRSEVHDLARQWDQPSLASPLFAGIESECLAVRTWHDDLQRLEQRADTVAARLDEPERLGKRLASTAPSPSGRGLG